MEKKKKKKGKLLSDNYPSGNLVTKLGQFPRNTGYLKINKFCDHDPCKHKKL